jgi:hypothetical protein
VKPAVFGIDLEVFVALLPNSYEGEACPDIHPEKNYIFKGYITGLRWDAKLDDWLYAVQTLHGRFWTWAEYIATDQATIERCVARVHRKVAK